MTEFQQIVINLVNEGKTVSEIAKLLNKSVRTIQREIKRGLVENLTTLLEIKYVYSADVSEQKYRYNMTAKGPNLKIDKDYKKVLDKLNVAEPNEVGDILKEYFRLKKRKNKK